MTSEYCIKPHIIAAEITKHRSMNIELTIEDEGWDFVATGVEGVVKETCDAVGIPYTNICFVSSNLNTNLKYFQHRYYGYNLDATMMSWNDDFNPLMPNQHCYGLFMSRPSNERLLAFSQYCQRRITGLCTFHFTPKTVDKKSSGFVDFIIQYPDQWNLIKNKLPHSDLCNTYQDKDLPIVFDAHGKTEFWAQVYSRISIEIVAETNVHNEGFFITEKILRPMLYKKPFVTIASKGFEQRLEDMGFCTFKNIIGKEYNDFEYYKRVSGVFNSVNEFFQQSVDVYTAMGDLLEHNKKTAIEFINEQKSKI